MNKVQALIKAQEKGSVETLAKIDSLGRVTKGTLCRELRADRQQVNRWIKPLLVLGLVKKAPAADRRSSYLLEVDPAKKSHYKDVIDSVEKL